MKQLFLTLCFVLIASASYSQDVIKGNESNILMAGVGGTDKYTSDGSEITFNKEIGGFCVVGNDSVLVTSIKEGTRYDSGTAVSAGKYNYLDNAIYLKAGETYAFDTYVIKMTISAGGQIMVNYRK